MIEQHYPNPNKPKKFDYASSSYPATPMMADSIFKSISITEWWRRNALVVAQAKETLLQAGDQVIAMDAEMAEKYGVCCVIGVVDKYLDFREKEWPKGDNPMIVSVYQLHKPDGVINATYDFFDKVKETT